MKQIYWETAECREGRNISKKISLPSEAKRDLFLEKFEIMVHKFIVKLLNCALGSRNQGTRWGPGPVQTYAQNLGPPIILPIDV